MRSTIELPQTIQNEPHESLDTACIARISNTYFCNLPFYFGSSSRIDLFIYFYYSDNILKLDFSTIFIHKLCYKLFHYISRVAYLLCCYMC